jgi:hypothetical protein
MKICCLTCTGDRPEMLKRSKFYFERAIKPCLVEWVVIDDGVVPFNPGGCSYYRREPDGPNSLGRNTLYGLDRCNCDYIFFWEDDDWYSPLRITNQIRKVTMHGLHGYTNSIYYNIKYNCYYIHNNTRHASLYETALSATYKDAVKKLIIKNMNNSFIDLIIWRELWHLGRLDRNNYTAVGIKGGPGRGGLGSGHKPHAHYQQDLNWLKLETLIGKDDTQWYKDLICQSAEASTEATSCSETILNS